MAENGCKWRALPEKYGNWHTIYCRVSRWARMGVLDKAFTKLQEKQIISLKIDIRPLREIKHKTSSCYK
jgi:transposase